MRLFYVWRGVDEWRAESCTVELNDEGLSARECRSAASTGFTTS